MELFRATVMPDKKLYRQAGDAFAHKMKMWKVFFIIGIIMCFVLAPVLTYFSIVNHSNDFIIMPTLGYLSIFYYYYAPAYMGRSLYKSQSKKNLTKEVNYSFNENNFLITTIESSSTYNYSAIEELYETDDLICLYFNKASAFIIPKKDIVNPRCDVRMFLESKSGKKFTSIKKQSTGKAVAKTIVIILSSALLSFLALGLAESNLDEPKEFTFGDYSITADGHFYEDESSTNNDYVLTSDYVSLSVDKYSQADINSALEKANPSLEEIAKSICDGDIIKSAKQNNHYTYTVTFYDNVDGFDYYNLIYVQQIDDTYWITQLNCEKSLENDYAEKFEKWVSSIRYKSNEA